MESSDYPPSPNPPEPSAPISDYPVTFSVDYPDRKLNRLTTFFRIFTVIPIAIIISPAQWRDLLCRRQLRSRLGGQRRRPSSRSRSS